MSLVGRLAEKSPPSVAVRAVAKLRRRLRSIRSRAAPPNVEIIERTFAVVEARMIGIAAELDIAERIASGPKSSTELAAEVDVDPDALDRMLALLASTGVFKRRRDGRWTNSGLSRALRASHRFSVREWARLFGGRDALRIWAESDTSVRTGSSATAVATGHEFFEWTTVNPAAGERFDAAMAEGSGFLAQSLAEVVEFPGVSKLCDVGGGTGTMLRAILAKRPAMQGVLFDLAPVIDRAPAHERIATVAGSFFEPDDVPAGCDRYLLVSVIHDWDDDSAVTILSNCRRAMAPGGRVLVVDQVIDPKAPLFQLHTDVMMLVLTGRGRERTEAQFRALATRAGLEVTRTWQLATLHGVFEMAPSAP